MKKTIFTLTMIAALAIANLQSMNAFSGGSGMSDDPYLISNVADLEEVRSVATEGLYFKMTDDITLSGEWIPIGTWGDDPAIEAFQGNFDGGGYTVSGLQVTNGNDRGLFGWVKNSTIKNLTVHTNETGISHDSPSGGDIFGILAGSVGDSNINGNSIIENCTVSGNVTQGWANCGGLLGGASGSTIINCRAENVNVQPRMWNAGGLVGVLRGEGTTITDCHVINATVRSLEHDAIGGIVGTLESESASTITGCTVTGLTLIGHDSGAGGIGAGGIAGIVHRANISDCTVTDVNLVSEDFGIQGGFIGFVKNQTTIDNCHVSGVTGFNLGGECGGFIGQIEAQPVGIDNCSVIDAELEGRGIVAGFIGKRAWDADGTISNCRAYATITTIPGSSWAEILGGFIGANDGGGAIRNCLFVGSIIQGDLWDDWTGPRVGGFAGLSKTDLDGCAAIATVKAPWLLYSGNDAGVGGFVGLMTEGGSISNCFFSGTVQGAGKVGGFVGTLRDEGAISNCYAHATVISSGNEMIGGFAGQRWNDGPAITDSYFIGSINQTGDEVGTFCGKNEGDNAISGCAQAIEGINPVGAGSHSVVSVAEADLKTLSAYTGLTGYVCEDDITFPYLSGQSAPVVVSKANPEEISGTLFNTAEELEVLFDYAPLASASPASTSWEIELPGLSIGDAINVLSFESDKMVSYPVLALIEEVTAIRKIDNDNDPVVSVRYFNLQGIEIAYPENNNIYIVKSLLQSGKQKAGKVLYRK